MKKHVKGLSLLLCLLLCCSVLMASCGNDTPDAQGETPTTVITTAGDPNITPPDPNNGTTTDDHYNYYTVVVQTAEGGVEGVMVQLCNDVCLPPVRTDATGKATVKLEKTQDITQWHVKMFKFPSGYAGSKTTEYAFAAGADTLTVTLKEYKVTVNDMFSNGIEDAEVALYNKTTGAKIVEEETNSAGTITFLLDAGEYSVTVAAPEGYQIPGDSNSWDLGEDGTATVILNTLSREITKTVTVTDEAGVAQAGVAVTVTTPAGETPFTGTTNAQGQISFTGDIYTNYSVNVGNQSYYFETFATAELTVVLSQAAAADATYVIRFTDAQGNLLTSVNGSADIVTFDADYNKQVVQTVTVTGGVGQCTLPVGTYSVLLSTVPNGKQTVATYQPVGFFDQNDGSKHADVILSDWTEQGTESNPILWENSNFLSGVLTDPDYTITMTAGQTTYLTFIRSYNLKLTLTGDATLVYGDVTYQAGDTVYFNETTKQDPAAVIKLTAGAAGDVVLTLTEVEGISTNPEVIANTSTTGTLTVDLTHSEDGYWYSYTASAAGTLTVSCETATALIVIDPQGGSENAANSASTAVTAGQTVLICIDCSNETVTELTVSWSLTVA